MTRRFINWLLSWFRSIPGEDGATDWTDDPCDEPQAVKRIYGNAIKTGEWKP